MEQITEYLTMPFIQKALLAGIFISAISAVLGVFLILKRLSMIGDGLAHVSFGSVALSLFLGWQPLYLSLPLAVISSLLILKLSQKTKMFGDAAIGIVASAGLAGGVMLASISNKFNSDLFSYLFGNILAVSTTEVYLSIGLSLVLAITVSLLYHELQAVTFDEETARTLGIKPETIDTILVVITSVTIVMAMKIVGSLLITALLILPAASALQIARSFRSVVIASILISSIAFLGGMFCSLSFNLPAGPSIVMSNLAIFLFSLLFKK